MRADEWIVDFLIKKGVTDVFGIPGVVVMDFLYAVDGRIPEITPHLSYHEQAAAFAACGYAQTSGKLGVAYSTRGPGVTNMITAIADAYYDSIPTMFITAHSSEKLSDEMRVMNNQEIDTVSLVQNVTKRAVRVDRIEDLQREVIYCYNAATQGRKGPVFLDIYNKLFDNEVGDISINVCEDTVDKSEVGVVVEEIIARISKSKRPIFLIGNGVRNRKNIDILKNIVNKFDIPVLSSRAAQDIIPDDKEYYGYVGSRATRYSNFILSKADLIIALGNRMAFPINSKSFRPIVENAYTIRIEVDESELCRNIPNSSNYAVDVSSILPALSEVDLSYNNSKEWNNVCKELKQKLDLYDNNLAIESIGNIIKLADSSMPIVCDVGNHSFWVTIAYAYQKAINRIMYSGSFGTLGCALPKAIGAYYSSKKPVLCFSGDQGVQFNLQELQYIASHRIPVVVVILNNTSSGMIMEREVAKHGTHLVHTTTNDGYSYPNFKKIANCFDINYYRIEKQTDLVELKRSTLNEPAIVEMMIDINTPLYPKLPVGEVCQKLVPKLPDELFEYLNAI